MEDVTNAWCDWLLIENSWIKRSRWRYLIVLICDFFYRDVVSYILNIQQGKCTCTLSCHLNIVLFLMWISPLILRKQLSIERKSGADPGILKPGVRSRLGIIFNFGGLGIVLIPLYIYIVVREENNMHIVNIACLPQLHNKCVLH